MWRIICNEMYPSNITYILVRPACVHWIKLDCPENSRPWLYLKIVYGWMGNELGWVGLGWFGFAMRRAAAVQRYDDGVVVWRWWMNGPTKILDAFKIWEIVYNSTVISNSKRSHSYGLCCDWRVCYVCVLFCSACACVHVCVWLRVSVCLHGMVFDGFRNADAEWKRTTNMHYIRRTI